MSTDNMIENRVTDLEMRFTRQDDLLEQLNSLVYEQQKQLAELTKMLQLHQESLATAPTNERPPHY
jgi:SlyX protein